MQRQDLKTDQPSSWHVQTSPPLSTSIGPSSGQDLDSRRRNPLACETCYKRKIKCEVEGSNTACIQCIRRNITCKFTTRKEKREALKRTQYVRTLEERVRRTESLLRAAGLLDEEFSLQDEYPIEDGDDPDQNMESDDDLISPYFSPRGGASRRNSGLSASDVPSARVDAQAQTTNEMRKVHATPDSPKGGPRAVLKSDQPHAPLFVMDNREEYRYFGRSSSMSILSREGLEWIKRRTGETKLVSVVFSDSTRDSPWNYWRPDVFHDIFTSEVFKPLPPRAEVFALLRDYFRTVNRLFPLYHEATFMQLVEWQYTQQTCDDAARWASINILLSLAYEYRFSNCQKSEKDRERAWLYYKNAMSVFVELSLRRTDLLSIQALLGMALFLRGNSGTQSSLPIITAALQACHRMGLHRNIARPHLSPAEQEQRRRVFWVAYILDQSTCIRAGSSPIQNYEDFDVDFPADNTGDAFVKSTHDSFFRQLCKITVIKSRMYSKLYSTKALEHKSPAVIFQDIRELHAELEEWKDANPFDCQLKKRGSGQDFLLGFASAGLQFAYYNTMLMIHRLPVLLHFASMNHIAQGHPVPDHYSLILSEATASSEICLQAARDTLKLINNLPWGDIAWIWSLLYYVFLAVMNIFVNILKNPQHPKAKEDLQSLTMAATFFATLIPGDGPGHYARFMTKMSANFERLARNLLERDQKVVKPGDMKSSSSKRENPTGSTTPLDHTSHSLLRETGLGPQSKTRLRISTSSSFSVTHNITHHIPPNIEGLPQINSSGYVVPDNFSPVLEHETSATPAPHPLPATYSLPPQAQPQSRTAPQTPLQPTETSSQQPPFDLSSLDTGFFPVSVNSDHFNFGQPGLWQIPLTADWELSPQALDGIFGLDLGYSVPEAAQPPTMIGLNSMGNLGAQPPSHFQQPNPGEQQQQQQQQQQALGPTPPDLGLPYSSHTVPPPRNGRQEQGATPNAAAEQAMQANAIWTNGPFSGPFPFLM
ncbi:transcription factor domain-containing protein [Aspergillus saccharolyticus JOP 1030-1]|uniref:Zn(2)-C6 fungal-type domain-containing protein n=1 Tax=Aspergillus saccharolyticus JOP 1030-1 TaxID=1450539 RepID=A0A318ZN64_9EURO|nr:hypothetical protein BP01DRAFT_287965 [Aspergillus saccharolyticus JOP 1030-1]PYH49051.1 hypothetical protein BP01DRAFT_287965 [Aspergillus saccharolyticus JOP 1030-1]